MIQQTDLSKCFEDYSGGNDVNEAMKFIKEQFQAKVKDNRGLHVYFIAARFKKDVKYTWEEVKSIQTLFINIFILMRAILFLNVIRNFDRWKQKASATCYKTPTKEITKWHQGVVITSVGPPTAPPPPPLPLPPPLAPASAPASIFLPPLTKPRALTWSLCPSNPIQSNPIPSHPIPSHPIPSHPIPSHPILSYPILSYPILSSSRWHDMTWRVVDVHCSWVDFHPLVTKDVVLYYANVCSDK